MSQSPAVSETHRQLWSDLLQMAVARTGGDEPLGTLGPHDPDNPYCDFETTIFPAKPKEVSIEEPLGVLAALLGDKDPAGRESPTQLLIESVREQLQEHGINILDQLEAHNTVTVATAHYGRFDPVVAALTIMLAEARKGKTIEEQNKIFNTIRAKTIYPISTYLRAITLDLKRLTGDPNQKPSSILDIIRLAGSVATTFPDTKNMKELAAQYKHLVTTSNTSAARGILGLRDDGQMFALAANATMEGVQDGIYSITPVTEATSRLMRAKKASIMAAAVSLGDRTTGREPFAIISNQVPRGEVDKYTPHAAMQWIAQTMTRRDIASTYGLPEGLTEADLAGSLSLLGHPTRV